MVKITTFFSYHNIPYATLGVFDHFLVNLTMCKYIRKRIQKPVPRQRPDRRSLAATDDRVRTRVPGSGPGPGRSSSSTVVRAMASGARRIEPPDEKSNGRGGLRTQSPFFHLLGSRCVYVYHPRAYKSQNSFRTPGVGFSESISGMGAV